MIPTLIFAIVFTSIGAGAAIAQGRASARVQAAHKLARKVDLALEPAIEPVVAHRLGTRARTAGITGALGGWVTVLVLAPFAPGANDDATFYGPLLVVLGYFVGHAVGYGAVAWFEMRQPVPPGPRMARASSPTHDDYVTRVERWGAWAAAGVATAIALAVVVLDRTGALDLGEVPWALVAATAALPWAAVLVHELLARRLLDRRQVASSPLELAWDDALRAQTLRDMVTVPIMTGLYLPIMLLGALGDGAEGGWPDNLVVGLTSGLLAVLLLGACTLALISIAVRPEKHFRTRLWGAPHEQEALR